MSTLTRQPSLQADDSLPNGDVLYEMVDGQLVEKDVSNYANWIANLLKECLDPFLRDHQLGKAFVENVFILDPERGLRRRPDVAVVLAEKWPIGEPPRPRGDCDLIPDVAVEVISPNDTLSKLMLKVKEYVRYGVSEIWVVIPEGQIVQVYRSINDVTTFGPGDVIQSQLIPGWSMPVVELLPHELEAEADDV